MRLTSINKMKVAIYLGWIRYNACGGVESFTRNLLDGFHASKNDNQYCLICSSDNAESFRQYEQDDRFKVVNTGIATNDLKKTLLFESFKLDRLVSQQKADFCFVPCYRMPLLRKKNKYVVVIHDLQAYHFPENFSFLRKIWLKGGAWLAAHSASKVVAISEYVKQDIVARLGVSANKVCAILNPILPNLEQEDFEETRLNVGIDKENYLYTISALAKNKNLITLLRLMNLIKKMKPHGIADKLVVSGIGFNQQDADNIDKKSLMDYIAIHHLEGHVIFTGFVSNERRNTLVKNSQFFLFPSIFEGFGMPVVEAMELGARVITTNCTSIPEVSENKAKYVDNPLDENEWLKMMVAHKNDEKVAYSFDKYDVKYVAERYLYEFSKMI